MAKSQKGALRRIDDNRWLVPRSYKPGMRVEGLIYASEALIPAIEKDNAVEQVANVACLPGIVGRSLAMPDIHWGYGFCIGGVAATDPEQGGVISPGGVGYDINCGVRLLRSDLSRGDTGGAMPTLVDRLFANVPCGVGQGGKVRFGAKELRRLLSQGAPYVVKQGFGWAGDLEVSEAGGRLEGADVVAVSERALKRGANQCGTLGSGNHFIEVQAVDRIYDEAAAEVLGLFRGGITVMIHSGSRGLGYQICDDALRDLSRSVTRFGLDLPDRQLVAAPVNSPEGQRYLGAMRAAANFAWANRQIMAHLVRETFEEVFGEAAEAMGLHQVYDVAHNIAKMERHQVDGEERTLCVHRKGATRAFPAGHPEVPEAYRSVGQPVLVPGDMGRYSFVLVGQSGSMEQSFGSCAHGAGRLLSRKAAIRAAKGRSIRDELRAQGVLARARGRRGLDEEQPDAYKDASEVVQTVHDAGLARLVARMKPLAVIKG